MTSEEIAKDNEHNYSNTADAFYVLHWLKEIAYQLAVANEQKVLELQRESERLNS